MDWDYTYFLPQDNPFRRKWSASSQDEATSLIVTEVNRCLPCVVCQRQIGEVATLFYEIDEKYYCSKCGFELVEARDEGGGALKKTKAFSQITL